MEDQLITEGARAERLRRAQERRRARGGISAWQPWQRWTLWGSIALAVLMLVIVLVDAFSSVGRIHPGVTVSGVKVGGMTPSAAASALALALPAKTEQPVTVVYKKKTWQVKPGDVGLSFDYPGLADQAMQVGRSGGAASSMWQRATAWFGKQSLEASPVADPAMLSVVLDNVASGTNVAPTDAKVVVKGTKVTVEPSATGIELKRAAMSSELLSTFLETSRTVEAPVGVAQPAVSDQAAEDAKTVVEKMIAAPVTVTFSDKSWTFEPAEIAELIAFRTVEASGNASGKAVLEPYVSAEEASKTIAPKLGAEIGKPAVDAKFKTKAGTVTIIPSQQGVGPDVELLAVNLTDTLKAPEGTVRSVELKTAITEPKLTTEKARAMGIGGRISTYTTTYDSSNKPRVNNIHTLGDALDGKLVPPGGTFSFNKAVGERTAEKGYQEANAIVNGKLVPQLGGGICQVGTTMFNAVFLSGLPVVERHNHSFYISHYPKGRDATVSWDGPDLKWKNDTDNWVLVSVSYSDSSITISLYGTDPGYEVTSETGPFTNETPFPTETTKDPTLAAGVKVVEDRGETGKKCVVTRTVKKGGQVVRTDTFTSNYKPKVEVVRVGTKVKGSKTPTATPTP